MKNVFLYVTKRGVQGWLERRAGAALGAVLGGQSQELKLGAFKGTWLLYPEYKKRTHFVVMTSTLISNVLEEARVSLTPEQAKGPEPRILRLGSRKKGSDTSKVGIVS